LAFLAGLALFAPPARASVEIFDNHGNLTNLTSVTMAQLLSGYSIQVDDKLFNNFTNYSSIVTGTNATTGLGSPVLASDIVVTGLDANPLNPGLNYQSTDFQISAGQHQDTAFQYDVSVVGGGKLMEDASQTLVSGNVGTPTSSIVISEQLTDGHGNLIAPLGVDEINTPGGFSGKTFDQKFFTTVNFAQVNKDIALTMSDNATGVTSFSVLQQNFSEVPEPSTMALVAVGAMGFVGYGLRRKARTA
jgi:hypothetical protein